jgi:hypothetical protein
VLVGLDWFWIQSTGECCKKETRNVGFHRRKLFLDRVWEYHILRENFTIKFFTENQNKNIKTFCVTAKYSCTIGNDYNERYWLQM